MKESGKHGITITNVSTFAKTKTYYNFKIL